MVKDIGHTATDSFEIDIETQDVLIVRKGFEQERMIDSCKGILSTRAQNSLRSDSISKNAATTAKKSKKSNKYNDRQRINDYS